MNLKKKMQRLNLRTMWIYFPVDIWQAFTEILKTNLKSNGVMISLLIRAQTFLKGRSKHVKSCFAFLFSKKRKAKQFVFFFLDDKNQYQPCSHAISCDGILWYHTRCKCKPTSFTSDLSQISWFDARFTTMSNVLSSRFNHSSWRPLKAATLFFFPTSMLLYNIHNK